jgi:hypothetical protein
MLSSSTLFWGQHQCTSTWPHEDVNSKMNPDSFKLQLQTVLTAYYEDINGIKGAKSWSKTSTRSSSASLRTKRIPEQRQTRTQLPTQLPTPPHPPICRTGALQPPPARCNLHRPPALPGALPPALVARASGWQVVGRMLGPKADAYQTSVLEFESVWHQEAASPSLQASQPCKSKAAAKLYYPAYTALYMVCTCLYDSKRVYTCIYMYIHVWTM